MTGLIVIFFIVVASCIVFYFYFVAMFEAVAEIPKPPGKKKVVTTAWHPRGCGCHLGRSHTHTWAELKEKGLWCNCDRCVTDQHEEK